MKQIICELLFLCAAASPGAKPIDDLAYGTVLYEYYQQNHQAALLNVLLAESRSQLGEEPVRFELAKGSFAFADGMYGYANDIFAAVPESELTPLDEMRLAFHMSREYHRSQNWQGLGEQLAKIDLGKSWLGKRKVHPEVQYMRAELAVHAGEYDQAELLFDAMEEQSPLRVYGLYNLGIAYRSNENLAGARRTFRRLSKMPVFTEEAYDLSQRARLALALIVREEQNTPRAEKVLADLPAEGRYQDVAMAAYGGLAMDTENYELAARIWMTLQEQDYWTPSTATARLGFPMSLEKLAIDGNLATADMALEQYRVAEKSFESRLTNLRGLHGQAEDPKWVTGLLEVFATPLVTDEDGNLDRDQQTRMQQLMQRWEEQLGHTDWLEWLSTENIHQALVQWRELGEMQRWLGEMPERLSALREVAGEQLRRRDAANGLLMDNGLLDSRERVVKQIEKTAKLLDAVGSVDPIPTSGWMYPLADNEERALLDQLDTMRSQLVHMDQKERSRWAQRVDRLGGVLFYRLAAEMPVRMQKLRKEHQGLAAQLSEIDERVARVEASEEQFVTGVATDFSIFDGRAESLVSKIESARTSRESILANEIRTRMQDEVDKVEQYLLVTRIAIARATDLLALSDFDVSNQ